MKNCISLIYTLLLIATSCQKASKDVDTGLTKQPNFSNSGKGPNFRYSGPDYSQEISVDLANTLIGSYLTSIDYENNPYGLRSFTFDADTLRNYLNDTTNGRIATIRLMLAHQESYIESNYGVNAGLDGRAITFIIVGLDENDNFVYNKNNAVYDNVRPCPVNCDYVYPFLK